MKSTLEFYTFGAVCPMVDGTPKEMRVCAARFLKRARRDGRTVKTTEPGQEWEVGARFPCRYPATHCAGRLAIGEELEPDDFDDFVPERDAFRAGE